ncbi:MAG: hypothetical protein IJ973_02395, partial [Christensenellaceae bacterium]|nr:hypothetical protein [Christensenellaceae bacterium]
MMQLGFFVCSVWENTLFVPLGHLAEFSQSEYSKPPWIHRALAWQIGFDPPPGCVHQQELGMWCLL